MPRQPIASSAARAQPTAPGYPLEELRGRLFSQPRPEPARAAIAALAADGVVRIEKGVVALADRRVSLEGEDARISRALEEVFLAGGLNPPDPDQALARAGAGARGPDLLAHLGDHVVYHDRTAVDLGNAFRAVGGVLFLHVLGAVRGACGDVVFGDPLRNAHGPHGWGGRGGTRGVARAGRNGHEGEDAAGDQRGTDGEPEHACFS